MRFGDRVEGRPLQVDLLNKAVIGKKLAFRTGSLGAIQSDSSMEISIWVSLESSMERSAERSMESSTESRSEFEAYFELLYLFWVVDFYSAF